MNTATVDISCFLVICWSCTEKENSGYQPSIFKGPEQLDKTHPFPKKAFELGSGIGPTTLLLEASIRKHENDEVSSVLWVARSRSVPVRGKSRVLNKGFGWHFNPLLKEPGMHIITAIVIFKNGDIVRRSASFLIRR